MDQTTAMQRAVAAAVALDVLGAQVARQRGLAGEPLLITLPRSLPHVAVLSVWGTALSGPFVVDGVLVTAALAERGHAAARPTVAALGVLRLLGVLAEPATWGRRSPRWVMLLSAAQVGVALALISAGRPSHRRRGASPGCGRPPTGGRRGR